jgi:hypothetical protein
MNQLAQGWRRHRHRRVVGDAVCLRPPHQRGSTLIRGFNNWLVAPCSEHSAPTICDDFLSKMGRLLYTKFLLQDLWHSNASRIYPVLVQSA